MRVADALQGFIHLLARAFDAAQLFRGRLPHARGGKLGIEQLKTATFDLVITDIIMPEMEGIETLINVKRQRPETQVIAMSGGGRTGNVDFLQTAQKLGAAAILHKPFTMASLASAVEEACGKAVTAAAHKLARLIYTMLTKGEEYTDQGQDYYEERYRQRVLLNLSRRAQQLGMKLVAIEQPA